MPIRIPARELKPITGTSDYELTARFEAFDDEKIFGMGQYQEKHMDKKGAVLELAHRNSQASVPFYVSSRGYGFFWNNPAIGTATFGMNKTEWYAKSTKKMDYFLTAGDTPAEILMQYTAATGRSPMMPEFGLGYWQCKLRYRNQQEILEVAREHKRRGLPMDAIVVDFFHWTMQGEFKFEPRDWPDPDAMVKELKELGIETVVSVWPTIDERSENYGEMAENGYLVQTDRGNHNHMIRPIRVRENLSGKNVKRTITRRAFVFSGWMRQSRNMALMILIITAIMQGRLYSVPIFIRSCMPRAFMMA